MRWGPPAAMTLCLSMGGLLAVPVAHAQLLGRLQGYVSDRSGGRLPGVEVTLEDVGRGPAPMASAV